MFYDNNNVWANDISNSNKLKNKGFTLLELIVYISLLSIIMTISIISVKEMTKFKKDAEVNFICKSTYSFLVSSCSECKIENQPGYIYIDKDKMYFKINEICKKSIRLGEEYSLIYNGNVYNNKIVLESDGKIKSNGTLVIKYKNEIIKTIAMNDRVIQIKYEEG